MKITVVIDNCLPPSIRGPYLAEHGLSLLIETEGKCILFDTGQSSTVVHNLSLMGIHPSLLDAVVISHGHYDHAGGLMSLLQHAQKEIPIYAHPDIFQTRVSIAGKRHFIGIPFTQSQLTELGAVWKLSRTPVEILPNLFFSGEIPKKIPYEQGDKRLLTCSCHGECVEDPINDDISLFCKSKEGLRLIGGCTHSGMINTIQYGLLLTGETTMHTWIGGTHLGPVSPNQQHETLDALEAMNPQLIAANHCTGFAMMAELSYRFKERFIPAFVGTVIEW